MKDFLPALLSGCLNALSRVLLFLDFEDEQQLGRVREELRHLLRNFRQVSWLGGIPLL